MELLTVILLLIAIWIFYKIYLSYNDIVNELKEIRTKCIRENISSDEAYTKHINENYTSASVKEVRDNVLSSLKNALAKVS